LFAARSVHAEVDADFTSREWEKLASNAPAGAFSVLTMQTDPIARSADVADLAARLVEECMASSRRGGTLPDGFAQQVVAMFSQPSTRGTRCTTPPRRKPSNGRTQRRDPAARRKHGIPTPISDMIVAAAEGSQRIAIGRGQGQVERTVRRYS